MGVVPKLKVFYSRTVMFVTQALCVIVIVANGRMYLFYKCNFNSKLKPSNHEFYMLNVNFLL